MLENMIGEMDNFDRRNNFSSTSNSSTSSSSSSSNNAGSRSMTPLSDTSASYDATVNSEAED